MYGHSVGHVQLREHIRRVGRHAVVKGDGDQLAARVDLQDLSHVAVEDARARRAVLALPQNIVVVARLHHAVALAEHEVAEALFAPTHTRGIQRRLQGAVERRRAGVALARRREHLNALGGNVHLFGQPRSAQLHHRVHQTHAVAAGEEEEIARGAVLQRGQLSLVHEMRAAHDGAALRLTENILERYGRNALRADEIAEHVPRADARQLVGVAHQHQPAAGPQRREQRAHQRQIDHRGLVHDHRVRLQRLLFVFCKGHIARLLVPAHAKQAVDGLRLLAAQLAHALGGAPRRRAEQHVQPHALKERYDAAHARRLARARPAGQDQQLLLRGQLHGLPLQWRILDALPALDLVDDLLRAAQLVRLVGKHGAHARTHIGLRLVTAPQIASLYVRHLLLHDASALDQIVERLFRRVRVTVEQLRRRRDQLFARQENMPAALLVVAQLKEHPRLRAAGGIARKAHRQRDLVRHGKIHAERLAAEEIRIAPQRVHRVRAVAPEQLHRKSHRQVVLRQEVQHAPQTRQLAPALRDLPRALVGDALDGLELLRLAVEHVERVRAEAIHQLLRRRRPDAAHHAGGEIVQDLRLARRHMPLHLIGGELLAVLRMRRVASGQDQLLAGRGAGDAAHHRHRLAVVRDDARDRIAVLLILENDRQDRTDDRRALSHVPLSILFRSVELPREVALRADRHIEALAAQQLRHTLRVLVHAAVRDDDARKAARGVALALERPHRVLQRLRRAPRGHDHRRLAAHPLARMRQRRNGEPYDRRQPHRGKRRDHAVLQKLHFSTPLAPAYEKPPKKVRNRL